MEQERIKVITRATNTDLGVEKLLYEHGCEIRKFADHYEVLFPPGTTSKPCGPLTASDRRWLTLPSGLMVKKLTMPDGEHCNLLVDHKMGNGGSIVS